MRGTRTWTAGRSGSSDRGVELSGAAERPPDLPSARALATSTAVRRPAASGRRLGERPGRQPEGSHLERESLSCVHASNPPYREAPLLGRTRAASAVSEGSSRPTQFDRHEPISAASSGGSARRSVTAAHRSEARLAGLASTASSVPEAITGKRSFRHTPSGGGRHTNASPCSKSRDSVVIQLSWIHDHLDLPGRSSISRQERCTVVVDFLVGSTACADLAPAERTTALGLEPYLLDARGSPPGRREAVVARPPRSAAAPRSGVPRWRGRLPPGSSCAVSTGHRAGALPAVSS